MSFETTPTRTATREKLRVFSTGDCEGLAELRHALERHGEIELVGATAGAAGRLLRGRAALAAFGVAWGFGFDWLMDVWAWSALGPGADASSFAALVAAGLPFDIAHAGGNAVIALVAGPALIRMLDRYAVRLRARFVPLEEPA